MERPPRLMVQRHRLSPKIAAISGALVLQAAAIYAIATGITVGAFRLIPHTVLLEVLKTKPPEVKPVELPPPHLLKPPIPTVTLPEIRIRTPKPPPRITVAKMPRHPVRAALVQTAGPPAPAAPPAPAKPRGITAPVSIGVSHSCDYAYPPTALRLNQQGTTTIKFSVSTAGSVSNVQVAKSSGHEMLDDAAIRCASSWRYRPALENGRPVAASWTANVRWKLQNGSA